MNSQIKSILFGSLLLLMILPLNAQKGIEDGSRYGHGEDSVRCIMHLSLYREFVKQGERAYMDALKSWRIVFNECPAATENEYIDGVKIFNYLIDKEEDPARKAKFMDTLRMIYDRRIEYFNDAGNILGRKAVDILRHPEYRQDPDIVEEAYGYLKESINLLKNKSSLAVLATFHTSSVFLFQNSRLTDMQMIENYALVSDIIDYQLSQRPGNSSLLRVKEATDANFIASGAPTCTSLVEYFQPKFEERKEDLAYLQRAVSFLDKLECEDDPFYIQAAEALYGLEPSAEAAFNLAKLFVQKIEYEKAIGYYKEAIENEEDPEMKGEYYYQLAFITNSEMNQPQLARTYAREAIRLRPDWGEPYILIGDAYASAKDCFEDEFEKSTIYWAAVDKYIQAKSVDPEVAEKADERIQAYRKYFPDIETIFFYSLSEGDPYTVGCWINETTRVRAR